MEKECLHLSWYINILQIPWGSNFGESGSRLEVQTQGEYQSSDVKSNSTRLILALLDHYLSISKVFKYCASRVINPDSAWYLTLNKGQTSNYFRKAIPGRVIHQSLLRIIHEICPTNFGLFLILHPCPSVYLSLMQLCHMSLSGITYSRLCRCCTARESCTRFSLVEPTKV